MSDFTRVTQGRHTVSDGSAFPTLADDDQSAEHRAFLEKTIEGEIIPRLMLAHRAADDEQPITLEKSIAVSDEMVADLVRIVVEHDDRVASSFVDALATQGVLPEALFSDLFPQTARKLGRLWEDDHVSFVDVTLGLCRLQRLVRDRQPARRPRRGVPHAARRALIAAVPGEQHILGAVIVEKHFTAAGWDVTSGPFSTVGEAAALLQRHVFTLAGLSVSGDGALERCALAIRAFRRISRNPNLFILVGGNAFHDRDDRVAFVGADATARDANDALAIAEELANPDHLASVAAAE